MRDWGISTSEADAAQHVKDMQYVATQLQDTFLKDKPFLCGDEISFADLMAVAEVRYKIMLTHAKVLPYIVCPTLGQWRMCNHDKFDLLFRMQSKTELVECHFPIILYKQNLKFRY